jgi:hypothetical protein
MDAACGLMMQGSHRGIQARKHMPNTSLLLEQLEGERETWKDDYKAAMYCRGIEETISRGISFFFVIHFADESWSKRVQAGTIKYDAKIVRRIYALYTWWTSQHEYLWSELEKVEGDYAVKGAEVFRQCYRDARNLLRVNLDASIAAAENTEKEIFADVSEGDWGADAA